MAKITETEIIIRSVDVDSDQIINNRLYFVYFEQGRLQHLRGLGVAPGGQTQAGQSGLPFSLTETACRFLAPGDYPDIFVVRTITTRVTEQGFTLGYEVVREEDGRALAMGSSSHVWINEGSGPAPLPISVRCVLLDSLGEVAADEPPRRTPGLTAAHPAVTKTPVIVRSVDVDGTSAINSAEYFSFLEDGRLHHMRRIGVLPKAKESDEPTRPFTIAETKACFRAPGFYPDDMAIYTHTQEVRRSSFVFEYEVRRIIDDSLIAAGSSAQVWLDDEGQPVELPAEIRQALLDSLG